MSDKLLRLLNSQMLNAHYQSLDTAHSDLFPSEHGDAINQTKDNDTDTNLKGR